MDYPKSVPNVGLVNGKFVDEDAASGVVGSLIPSAWGNAVTDELLAVIAGAGIAPVEGTNNQVLAALKSLVLKGGVGRLLRTTIYINNGGTLQSSVDGAAFSNASSTFIPHPLATFAEGEVLGAGGGGGGCAVTGTSQVAAGSGGGGGGYSKKRAPIASFSGLVISVGAPGTTLNAANGGNGGSSAIGNLISAAGGGGGSLGPAYPANNAAVGGASGGTGSGGDLNGSGGPGQWALYAGVPQSGAGGGSRFGPGPISASGGTPSNGIAATNYGTGGSGGAIPAGQGGAAGGSGKGGLVIINEYA